jgi:hypothetical protein
MLDKFTADVSATPVVTEKVYGDEVLPRSLRAFHRWKNWVQAVMIVPVLLGPVSATPYLSQRSYLSRRSGLHFSLSVTETLVTAVHGYSPFKKEVGPSNDCIGVISVLSSF